MLQEPTSSEATTRHWKIATSNIHRTSGTKKILYLTITPSRLNLQKPEKGNINAQSLV
jgi:hypothetical protein